MAVLCVLLGSFPVYTSATSAPVLTFTNTPDIFITEIQTNGGNAAQEFIELYNLTDHDIKFDNSNSTGSASEQWRIQFFNSTSVKSGSPTWATTASSGNSIVLHGII